MRVAALWGLLALSVLCACAGLVAWWCEWIAEVDRAYRDAE